MAKLEAQFVLKDDVAVISQYDKVYIRRGEVLLDLGDLSYQKIRELEVGFNRLNQHLFPEKASFNLKDFLEGKLDD